MTPPDPSEFKPGAYEHYKGGKYFALALGRHHESGELMVAYVSCSHVGMSFREWATPGKDSWTDVVTVVSDAMGSSPRSEPRFRYLGPAL